MSTNIEAVIQEKIHVLPLAQKKVVLAFIENLEKDRLRCNGLVR